jgi:hypothetical protein
MNYLTLKTSHLTHNLPLWNIASTKRAISHLYNNHLLRGNARAKGIELARKISRREWFNDEDISFARSVIRSHAPMIATSINNEKLNIN